MEREKNRLARYMVKATVYFVIIAIGVTLFVSAAIGIWQKAAGEPEVSAGQVVRTVLDQSGENLYCVELTACGMPDKYVSLPVKAVVVPGLGCTFLSCKTKLYESGYRQYIMEFRKGGRTFITFLDDSDLGHIVAIECPSP